MGFGSTASFTSQTLINQVSALGFAALETPKAPDGKWIALADFTMNQGPSRLLTIGAVNADCMSKGEAPKLYDMECLSVNPMIDTKGEDISSHYEKTFDKVGWPAAFLQDGAGNLRKAVEIINDKRNQEHLEPIPIIQDIGHFSAAIIKKHFHHEDYMETLQRKISAFSLKVRVGPYSFLSGPKARTAGRYMGHMKSTLQWLYRLKQLSTGKGRPSDGTIRAFILDNFPNLTKTLKKLRLFIKVIETEENILKRLKNESLNEFTRLATQSQLGKLKKNHFYRIAITDWLTETWKIKRSLGLQESLLVSSDILESANGQWKQVTRRITANEATHLVLAFPILCGAWSRSRIISCLNSVSIKGMRDWCAKNVPISMKKLSQMDITAETTLDEISQTIRPFIGGLEGVLSY